MQTYNNYHNIIIAEILSTFDSQYPVASPSSSITSGITLLRWLIYLLHLSTSTVAQNPLFHSQAALLWLALSHAGYTL